MSCPAPRPLILALLLAACEDGKVPIDDSEAPDPPSPDDSAPPTDDSEGDSAGDSGAETVPGRAEPWARDEQVAPGSATFTEIHYNDPSSPSLEWVEVHNPMSYDLDLSGWRLEGGLDYTFPEGTVVAAGGYAVVAADPSLLAAGALGPYTGSLANDGERLTLTSNGGRRMDTVEYDQDDPWPVGADGSGFTLAKVHPTDASDRAEHWSVSAEPGGTPGAANGIDPLTPPTEIELLALDATWSYDDSGDYPASDWADLDHDDSGWATGEAPFYAGEPAADAEVTVRVTADNYYAVYLGEADGTDLRLLAEDADGNWTTAETYTDTVTARDHLYVAAWESPSDYGGPQMVIAEAEIDGEIVGTSATDFEWILGPVDGSPGASPPDAGPDEADLLSEMSGATWDLPAVETGPSSDPWGWALSSSFDPSTQFIWVDTFSDTSVTNIDNTYALFRSVSPLLGETGTTELETGIITTTFRARFELDADPAATELFASCKLDDGAVFYLNGVEVLRENMPSGAVNADTLASDAVDEVEALSLSIPTGSLVRGENVLAVEVHQAETDDPDMLFGCALTARVSAQSSSPTVVLNEVAAAGEDWVELTNVTETSQDLTDLELVSSDGDVVTLSAGSLDPGELVQVDGLDLEAGAVLFLRSAGGGALLDAVRVSDRPRGRLEAGGWGYPSEATPGAANTFDLVEDVVINEIMYHRAPRNEAAGYVERDEEWIELLNRGEAEIDLSGWQLVDAVKFSFPDGTTLGPGEALVVSNDAAALSAEHAGITIVGDYEGSLSNSGDRILLLDANGNPADEVRYYDGGRWPGAADGGGASLELMNPWADNNVAESWSASDELSRSIWATYTIEGTASPSAVGPDGTWDEFVMGLLDEGEILLDDLSVVQDPDSSAIEVLQNGSFDDLDAWRIIGTHRHSELVADPDDPDNTVLRLVATGPTEHMHNHAETTLTRGVRSTDYRIRFRARWVSGSNQLHTRLYFNRLPTTTLIVQPEDAGTPGATNSTAVDNLGPSFDDLAQDLAVPQPGEEVEISVLVADPDGVADVSLWSAVDGGAWTSTPMSLGADGRYAATLDGQDAGAIVQFYVEAADSLGETATFPAAGPDSRALVQFDDGEAGTTGLHNLRLIMTEADSDWLLDDPNLMSNDALGGTVVYDEAEVFYDVGVRAKGSERGRPEDVRLGYSVRFPPDHLFRGSHSSALIDRSEGVSFGQREHLMNLVMMRAGAVSAEYNDLIHVITPRDTHTGPAELQLDRSTGLVLASQFEGGADGEVFDYELIYYPYTTDDGTDEGQKLPQPDSVVGTYITDLGTDKEDYRWNFMLQNNTGEDDYTRLIALGQTFAKRGTAAFLTEAEDVIDVDQWMRAFAVATLAGAVDNYGGDSSQHNARFYVRPEDGKVLYFPHDLDYFGSSSMAVVGNIDLYYLIQDPVYERLYYQHLHDLLSRAYTLDYLQPWCDQLGELLPSQDFDYNCGFIDDRAAYVSSGASDSVSAAFPAVSFAITTNGGSDLSTTATAITLEGRGWIDVREIRLDGVDLGPVWIDGQTWQVEVPLEVGANPISLEAYDLGGALVGSDAINVVSSP